MVRLRQRTMVTSRTMLLRISISVFIVMSAMNLSVDAFAPPATTFRLVLQVERTAAHLQHVRQKSGQSKAIASSNSRWPMIATASSQRKPSSLMRSGPLSSKLNYLDSLESQTNAKNVKDSRSKNLDRWLERLTTAFPLFVLTSALTGYWQPRALLWVNHGSLVTAMLAAVMWGTGLTLEKRDFTAVWGKPENRIAVPLGVFCQFAIMPLTAYLVGKELLLPAVGAARPDKVQEALFLGLCLVGCSPGGTASNLVSLIARANVALSVILTTCSTLAAVVMTPLLVQLLVGSTISISGMALCAATAKVVLLPVLTGMLFKAKAPRTARNFARFTPFASVVLVSLICGGVVAQTVPLLTETTTAAAGAGGWADSNPASILGMGSLSDPAAIPRIAALSGLGYWTSMHPAIAPVIFGGLLLSSAGGGGSVLASSSSIRLPMVLSSVLLLHLIGFAVGYIVPKAVSPGKETTARTIAIEVGMQNSALAVVLARSIGAHPAASLPGALSATVHSCLGSILAAFWRTRRNRSGD